ncbi:hypothetical protein M2158_004485 [Streptomyces sp. SAI-144]|uniref:hypothetical protein n=1 Tax=Streptomyces sp. SAI-144 TaxID=2940544 RepID=UPI0024749CB5|nr:hypothetical protein [Streptomyces sp. SAI-144]MDH6435945.1 hypothetical protein [Streptomyces sp. SAI-144]
MEAQKPEEQDEPPGEVHFVYADDTVGVTESHVVDGFGEGGETIVTGGDGHDTSVQADPAGSAEVRVGRRPSKPESELRTAQLLVQRLNQDGAQWDPPHLTNPSARDERGIDCEASGPNEQRLKIQVTTPERAAWRELAHGSDFRASTSEAALVEALRVAIEAKKTRSDPEIHLALDAVHAPAHALRSVAQAFRRQHGVWAASVGFLEIWLVGPSPDLVQRLAP